MDRTMDKSLPLEPSRKEAIPMRPALLLASLGAALALSTGAAPATTIVTAPAAELEAVPDASPADQAPAADPAPVVSPPPAAPAPAHDGAKSGHYDCAGGQDDQYSSRCIHDPAGDHDPGPNAGSTEPAATAAAGDVAYAEDMVAQFCAAKPWQCADGPIVDLP